MPKATEKLWASIGAGGSVAEQRVDRAVRVAGRRRTVGRRSRAGCSRAIEQVGAGRDATTDARTSGHRGDAESGGQKRDLTYPPLPAGARRAGLRQPHAPGDRRRRRRDALDYREHLDRASSVGVRGVVQVGTDLATSRVVRRRSPPASRACSPPSRCTRTRRPLLRPAGAARRALAGIDELAALPRVRAIGETGLDFFRTGDGRPRRPAPSRSRRTSRSRRSTTSR